MGRVFLEGIYLLSPDSEILGRGWTWMFLGAVSELAGFEVPGLLSFKASGLWPSQEAGDDPRE